MAKIDMKTSIGSVELPNPTGVASGTFGYGSEYESLFDLSQLGVLYTKAVTLEPRPGNAMPRIIETPGGLINSIGLANVGTRAFVQKKFPYLKDLPCKVFINVAGSFEDDYLQTLEYLDEHAPLDGYEINLSCPNVKCGGMALGTDPVLVERLTADLRKRTTRPLVIKLSPNVTDISEIARAAEAGGADGVSCINTLVGMAIDTKAKKSVLPGMTGGLSGPAILPVGLAAVYRVSRVVKIPVVGIGGISEPDHVVQYLLAGASSVQTGTINFIDPDIIAKTLEYLGEYMDREAIETIDDFHSFLPGFAGHKSW